MLKTTNCIYLYSKKDTNIPLYVGKTKNALKIRHKDHTKKNNIYGVPFDKIATEMGWDNIKLEVLEKVSPLDDLAMRERFYYIKHRPLYNKRFPKYSPEDLHHFKIAWETYDLERECLAAMKI